MLAARDKKLTHEAEEEPFTSQLLRKGICRRRKCGSQRPVAGSEKSPLVLQRLLAVLKMVFLPGRHSGA